MTWRETWGDPMWRHNMICLAILVVPLLLALIFASWMAGWI